MTLFIKWQSGIGAYKHSYRGVGITSHLHGQGTYHVRATVTVHCSRVIEILHLTEIGEVRIALCLYRYGKCQTQ